MRLLHVCLYGAAPGGPVAPGKSADVTLEWKSKLYVGLFRQTATILTNDPGRREVTLSITGRFTGPVGVVPSQLVLQLLAVRPGGCERSPRVQLPEGVAGNHRL